MNGPSIITVVVTYNRLELLKENIKALRDQTQRTDILIVDNCSTDGTGDYVKSIDNNDIIYRNTGNNLGGAGGFAYGIKIAAEMGYEYAWIMDDDSIPEKDALEQLCRIVDSRLPFSFLASMVFWTDGRIFPMNRPTIQSVNDDNVAMIRNCKVFPIESCSFVGCFFPLKHAFQAGLPISEFFIYGDDVEYTRRLRKFAPAYWVMDSEIVHKAPSIEGADIVSADVSRINRFYYQTRNGIYISKEAGFWSVLKCIGRIQKRIVNILKHSKDHKLKRINVIFKGIIKGFIFKPQIEYPTNETRV